nr:complement C4-like [Megalopta genalis]
MVVMEVSLPSGFTADRDSLPSLEVSQNVKRVETKDGDTVVILYFDKMDRREYCPTVSAFRTHKVAKQKPVPVTIYDYYDSSRKARVFYEPRKATLCDLCKEEDCEDLCVSQLGKQEDSSQSAASCQTICTYLQLLLLVFFSVKYFEYF